MIEEEEFKSVGFIAKKWGLTRSRVHQFINQDRIDEKYILVIDNGYQGQKFLSTLTPKPTELKRGAKKK